MTTPDQPGWYDDPQDPNAQRYWDGQDWTPHRQRKMTSRSARQSATSAPQQPAAPPNLPPSPSGATPQDQLPRVAQRQRFWSGLSGRQKIIVVAVIVVMAVIIVPVFAFSHGAHRSPSPAGPSRSPAGQSAPQPGQSPSPSGQAGSHSGSPFYQLGYQSGTSGWARSNYAPNYYSNTGATVAEMERDACSESWEHDPNLPAEAKLDPSIGGSFSPENQDGYLKGCQDAFRDHPPQPPSWDPHRR